jgi:hypothetical protein
MKRAVFLVLMLVLLGGCSQEPKQLLLGKWQEDMTTANREEARRIRELARQVLIQRNISPSSVPSLQETKTHAIEFFPDGTAVEKTLSDDGTERTATFTWTLSADGHTLKTDQVIGGTRYTLTARIVLLNKGTLQIDEPSSARGLFQRVE